ncbi:MAP3K epsilon protein kinase 1-like protein [Drosera capensis]
MSRDSRPNPSGHFHKSRTLENKFILGDEIGKGAYGRVYKGLDLQNGAYVAIKQVSLENIGQEDLNIIMNLNHKNIVKYLGSLKTKSHLHIILEYVENGSLANIIKPAKFGPFPEQLVAHYIAQVLEGLVYLHEQGVIHRDIKGANILATKEGLVKLADFGVATKLTEADINTHSVVGTPYWMAPEVIEMSGVCAASDIWSVGCTVIELHTCVPPYYDLQPMPALFRIVQDDHPPIPDWLSSEMSDFLRQCFQKDAKQRPDAKTLLSHPWILYRRNLQPSLSHNDAIRSPEEDSMPEAEVENEDGLTSENSSAAKAFRGDRSLKEVVDDGKSDEDPVPSSGNGEEKSEVSEDFPPDHIPMPAIHEKRSSDSNLMSPEEHDQVEVMTNGELESSELRKDTVNDEHERKGSAVRKVNSLFSFGPRSHDGSRNKSAKAGTLVGDELSKFIDTPGDASLDDLFRPLNKTSVDQAAVASGSATSSHVESGGSNVADAGKHELAIKLRAAIAQKQMENETGPGNAGNLFRVMMHALKEDDRGLVFDEKLPGESLYALQAVEFSRLVGSLRPEEPEDVIVSACQKLLAFFHQRPDQKMVFVTQHGLLPLMELLEIPRPRVTGAVLQVINQIIKDNLNFLENACLVGLIPIIMGFAGPDRPREVRMEAAYFLQHLCQSSTSTLQMFIACRGIPVLVGFLEADYAKYREMVHLAIDGMWQVFKLQGSTPRADFCRIAAKNGILLRLTNTLYSLNEATRLAATATSSGNLLDGGLAPKPRSGQLNPSHPAFGQKEHYGTEQQENRLSSGNTDSSPGIAPQENSHASFAHSQKQDVNQSEPQHFNADSDRPRLSNVGGGLVASRSTDSFENIANLSVKDASRGEVELRQQRNRMSVDRPLKSVDSSSDVTQQDHVRPLLSLLEKEPPSRHLSNFPGIERHESILPLLHSTSGKKTNEEMDFLMAEFAEVSGRGRENGNAEGAPRLSLKALSKRVCSTASNDGAASTSTGLASQTASGVLSGSGILNARQGSAASSGLLSNMVSTMNTDVAREYLEKVAELLLEFTQADSTVKSYMCSQSLLTRLFHMFNRVEPPILLKLLKCINHLSTDPNCLENLQRAEAIKHLIPNLELKEGPLISQIHHEVLNALFNLCKINKRRQEQAAENGIVPHLMSFIMSNSPLRQYALPLLCDMAHASRNSREQLRAHGGLDVYLSLLDDELWSVTALDSIAVCLAHDNDNRKVEQALLKKDAVQKLVKFFQNCPEQHFVNVLEPFLKIMTKSPRINTTLAVNGLTALLIAKLDHQDAIARLNLLKLIKAVYEHHPRPKQLIVENDLPQKLQNLIEERREGQSGQVLVKQMATSLLKALHINTVL